MLTSPEHALSIHRKAECRTLLSVAKTMQDIAWRDAAPEGKMRNNCALSRTGCRLTLLAVFALGLASQAPTAQAQSQPDKSAAASKSGAADSKPGAAASEPSSVPEVTVDAPPSQVSRVPPAKAAALAAEAAKNEAWRKYRDSMPPLTRDPNDLAKDFPGLQSYAPQ